MMHVHWHETVGWKGTNRYGQCRCGNRRVYTGSTFSPIDRDWLAGAHWSDKSRPVTPPQAPVDRR